MMGYQEIVREENENVLERNRLVVGRIREMLNETAVDEKYQDYFKKTAEKILLVKEVYDLNEKGEYRNLSQEELASYNKKFFEEF